MAIDSRPRRAGHVLGVVLGLAHLSVLGVPTDEGDAGPPMGVIVVGAVLGLAIIGLLVESWRHDRRGPRRIAAVVLVVAALGALPGLLVSDVPAALQVGAGVLVLLTIAAVVLLFYPQRDLAELAGSR